MAGTGYLFSTCDSRGYSHPVETETETEINKQLLELKQMKQGPFLGGVPIEIHHSVNIDTQDQELQLTDYTQNASGTRNSSTNTVIVHN